MGKDYKGFLVTVVDRISKFLIIQKVLTKHTNVVTKALIEIITPVKAITHTITCDNGKESDQYLMMYKYKRKQQRTYLI